MKTNLNKFGFTEINLIKLWELLISNSNDLKLGVSQFNFGYRASSDMKVFILVSLEVFKMYGQMKST